MLQFLRHEVQFILIALFWVVGAIYGGILIYAVLPLTVFLFYRQEAFTDMLFGFLLVLVLSDMTPEVVSMRKVKTAKYAYIIALTLILLVEQHRFKPLSGVFRIFLPFFVYAFFPLVFGNDPLTGIQKTLSYALLYLAVPNYVLINYRRRGWEFFRDLVRFFVAFLVVMWLIRYVRVVPVYVAGRFRGLFGNPNGLGIFTFLVFVLYTILNNIRKDLFPFRERMVYYGVIVFFLVLCGSRTSLVATFMFLLFSRFFSLSPFIGFIGFITLLALVELVSSNLSAIVISLGLQEYFRVETLDDGSGRYIAWRFAWSKIQDYFMLGGGFGNDEYIMRHNYAYLRSLGHHGGVHNSYLTMWFNVGIVGILIFFRSYFLVFFKASKRLPIAYAAMFAVMFSVLYESWLTGSLNPFTIILLMIMTVLTEPEIVDWEEREQAESEAEAALPEDQLRELVPGQGGHGLTLRTP